MADKISRTIVIGAARLLANEITATRPQQAQDVLDYTTYETINNWVDIGVTKSGVYEENDDIIVQMSELNLDKFSSGQPFQLCALWNDSESDEVFHIAMRSYSSVTVKSIDRPEVMHEGKVITVVFART